MALLRALLLMTAIMVPGSRVAAESTREEPDPLTDDAVVIKTEGSHQLLLPKDWPVHQDKDGRVTTASMEEYISMKFRQVRARFGQVDDRLAVLERQTVQLEKDQSELLRGLKVLEERQQQEEDNHGDQAQTRSEAESESASSE